MPRNLRPLEVFPITTRHLEVLRVADVTPGMRRVTIGGAKLAAHTAENGFPVGDFRSDGFDDEFKILLKHPDADRAVGPTQMDGVLHWPRENPHLVMRTYTVRRWDAQQGEIDIDLVMHGVGPATRWARHVQPGDPVQIAGPKMSMGHPDGADVTIVAGDETALPAIARWLEQWPAGATGRAFVEVADRSHRQELAQPDGVEITWLYRDGAEPGSTTLLADALKAMPWPEGKVFAWVAGETLTLVPIRRWLRQEKGLPAEQVEVTGYWRKRDVVLSADDAEMPDLDATQDAAEQMHELSEIAPGFALRVAVTIGLPSAFQGKSATTAELAHRTGTPEPALRRLLRYLVAIGVAQSEGDRFRLTDLGRQLEVETVSAVLDLTGPIAHRELGGMLSLLSAVRTGSGDYERWFGAPFDVHEEQDEQRLRRREDREQERAVYVAGAVARATTSGVGSMVVAGPAAGSFADAVLRHRPAAQVQVTTPEQLGAGPQVGAVLLTDVLKTQTDEAVSVTLRAAAGRLDRHGRLFVVARPLNADLADDHDYEDDLIEFAIHGGGLRTHEEYLALFGDAGLEIAERRTVGWGWTLYTLGVR